MSNPIRKLRTERAWSQEQLAEMAGLSVRTVQRAENGAPSGLETLKSLAAVFEVSLDTLRSEDADKNEPDEEKHMENTIDSANNNQQPTDLEITIRRSATLAVILAMLALINYVTMPQYLWVKWAGLGIGLAILGMWANWLSSKENQADREPKNMKEMLNTTGIMLASGFGLFMLNATMSPGNWWVIWPLGALAIAIPILWVRFLNR